MSKYGFALNKSKTHCFGMLSSLFDVNNEIPINYSYYTHKNERIALVDQIKYLHKNDVIIADRGYFSKKIIKTLYDNNISFIMRIQNKMYN